MTADLIAFLNARHEEAETATRNLLAEAQRVSLALKEPRLLGKEIPGWGSWRDVEQMCTDRLADIDAKRRILDLHDALKRRVKSGGYASDEYALAALEVVASRMAVPYAEHPDYRPEWKPA